MLRSESESHFLPADWPTFAQLDAWARRDPSPLFRSARPQVQPRRAGDPHRGRPWSRKALGYEDRVLGGTQGRLDRPRARAAAPLLALRRGRQAARPRQARDDRDRPRPARVPGRLRRGAREPGDRRPHRPGLRAQAVPRRAAATSWSAPASPRSTSGPTCIEAGAQCIALRRNPQPDEQDLNVPRCLFDGSGIDAFQGLTFDQRARLPRPGAAGHRARRGAAGPRDPAGRDAGPVRGGDRQRHRRSSPGPAGLKVDLELVNGTESATLDVTGIVCGTGFVKSALALPLLRRLVADLRRAGRARAHQAQDELRRAAARPRRLAPLHDGDQREHGRARTATRSPASSTSPGASSATASRAEGLKLPLASRRASRCRSRWRGRPSSELRQVRKTEQLA